MKYISNFIFYFDKWIGKNSRVHWTLADQVLVSGGNFLSVILLARFLSIDEFGVFSIAWIAIQFFVILQTALITSPMMSLAPKKSKQGVFLGAVLIQSLVFCLLTGLLATIIFSTVNIVSSEAIRAGLLPAFVCAAVFVVFQDFVRRYFFVVGNPKISFLSDTATYIFRLAFFWFLLSNREVNSEHLLWLIAFTSLIGLFVVPSLVKEVSFNRNVFFAVSKEQFHLGRWLASAAIMQWICGNFLVLSAAFILGPASAGILKAVQNVVGVFNVCFSSLENYVPIKAASKYVKGQGAALREYLFSIAINGTKVVLPLALLIALFSEKLMVVLYGDSFSSYDDLLIAYVIVYVLTFYGLLFRIVFRTIEKTKPIFLSYILAAAVSIVVAVPFIYLFGLLGVVLGLIVVYLVMNIYYFLLIKKFLFSESNNVYVQ